VGRLPWWENGSVFLTRTSTGVFFTWPSLESSSLDPLWSLLYSTLYWILLHLTLSEVSFFRPSTGAFFTWPSLESPLFDSLLESSSLDPLWSLLCSTLCWSLLVWFRLSQLSLCPGCVLVCVCPVLCLTLCILTHLTNILLLLSPTNWKRKHDKLDPVLTVCME